MRVSKSKAKELGIPTGEPAGKKRHWEKPGRPKKPQFTEDDARAKLFGELCKAHGLPNPEAEYQFPPWEGGNPDCTHADYHQPGGKPTCKDCGATRRKWRFDYLFSGWLAVEIECNPFAGPKCGVCGQQAGGRHNIGQGFLDDMEKYNEATILGYALIRVTNDQVASGEAFAIIRRALLEEDEQP